MAPRSADAAPARLSAFLEDVLGSGAATLHRELAAPPQLVSASSLGWSEAVMRGFGHAQVYGHQARAYQLLHAGEHLIITTPTASGKTGAFFPAVFERLHEDPAATALLVYPLVALGQDQGGKLTDFSQQGAFSLHTGAFQGAARAEDVFTPSTRLVTATPDKLHWALTHPAVQRFLSRLSFLVLDEAHTYRGGFGSEVAGMLRRLLSLSRALGASPQVVLSTATIGNPAEFARELVGIEAQEVSESGAARHGKQYVLADHHGQPRRFWDAVMAASSAHNLKVLAFFRGRSRASRLYGAYRSHPRFAGLAHLYMAGTSDREGRLSEFRRARSGVMFATNALEAGVDIGDLEVVVIDGYPGSRMAFRQMAGRAGRASPGLVLYLPALDERGLPHPVDAFYSNAENFRELLTGKIERAVVEPENPYLAPRHAARAQEELRVAGLSDALKTHQRYWNLRGEGSAKYLVVEAADYAAHPARALSRPLESPSEHYALTEKHIGAVFTLEGQGYKVLRWEKTAQGTAVVAEKFDAGQMYTRGLFSVHVRPGSQPGQMGEWRHLPGLAYRLGEVQIQRRYSGYALMRQVFMRVCTRCDREPGLHERVCRSCGGRIQDRMQDHKLSEHSFDEAVELPPFATVALEVGIDARATELPSAVAHTLKHLFAKLIPEAVACDENDLAGAFREGRDDYFFLYDDWLGGLGVARRAYEQLPELLHRALALTRKSCCTTGCYECISVGRCSAPFLASGERRPTDKAATRAFLEALLGERSALLPASAPAPGPERDWPREAQLLLDLQGLALPEVSARLGVPSRELQRAVAALPPLRLRHSTFGVGTLVGGGGRGEKREVTLYFPGVGQRRLVVALAGLTPEETPQAESA